MLMFTVDRTDPTKEVSAGLHSNVLDTPETAAFSGIESTKGADIETIIVDINTWLTTQSRINEPLNTFGDPFVSPSVAAAGGTQSFNITGFSPAGFLMQELSVLPSIDVDDYTVEFYREDTFTTRQYDLANVLTSATAPVKQIDELIGLMLDDDNTGELHVKITNDDPVNAATFTLEFRGTNIFR